MVTVVHRGGATAAAVFMLLWFPCVVPAAESVEGAEASFEAVATIFEHHCIRCHSSQGTVQGDVALERYAAIFGEEAAGVVRPGNAQGSRLLQMVRGPEPRMPKHSSPLEPEQVAAIERWIEAGAPWPDRDRVLQDVGVPDANWWSFKPLEPVALPDLSEADAARVRTPIDAFVLAQLREQGLSPSPEADRRTLIRRLSYDLTGLPPSFEQVEAFVADPDPAAYEKLVDKLLASPAYGERWGRHWLDLAGYGDTHGFDKDQLRPNAYPYRDYVIRAFNDDKPFARFVKEQVAGDVLYPGEPDGVIATGFIVAGPWDFVGHVELREGTMDKKLTRVLDRDEMVHTVLGGFTSLTVNCARCHTHKFDPISHTDYHRMQAVFAGVERAERPVPAGPEAVAARERIEGQLAEVEGRLATLERDAEERGGPELREAAEARRQLTGRAGVGNASHGYHSDIASNPNAPAWVQVDLGESVELRHVVLAPAHDNFNNIGDGFGFPVRFRIELSDDPAFEQGVKVIDNQTAADVDNPGINPWVASAEGHAARYVRVTVTKRAPRQNDYVFALAELAAIDDTGRNVAAGRQVTASDSIEAGPRWGSANLVNGIYPAMSAEGDVLAELAEVVQRHALLHEQVYDEATRRLRAELRAQRTQLREQMQTLEAEDRRVFAAASTFSSTGNFTPPPNGQPRPIHILDRGEVSRPGEEVGPGAVSALAHLSHHFDSIENASDEGQRRAALAHWLVDEQNPLTWRSIVNRVWHHHFGQGIVASLDDFGRMGALPTHPELLDWLAIEFRDNGGSLKDLHRMIVLSSTYRQESQARSDMAAVDSGNRYLWRMNGRRLEAEAIRDTVLLLSGSLDRTMYGPGYRLFGFVDDHSPHYLYEEYDVDDPATHRRSIYRFIVRSVPDPFMETLDCADPSENVHQRDATLTALQALSLLNNPFMVRQAELFAERLEREAATPTEQIELAFQLTFGREAEAEEVAVLEPIAREHGMANVARVILNSNELVFVD